MDIQALLKFDFLAVAEKQVTIMTQQKIIDDPSSDEDAKSQAEDAKAKALQELAQLLQGAGDLGKTVPKTPIIGTTGSKIKTPKSIQTSGVKGAVIKPNDGGIILDGETLVPFTGFDPDIKANIFSYDADLKTWECPDHDPNLPDNLGPVHPGQLRPTSVKDALKTETRCSTMSETIVYNGLEHSSGDTTFIAHRSYMETIRKAVIVRGMFGVFMIPDAANPEGWDLFHKHGRFTVLGVQSHILKLKLTADSYLNNNLKWSGDLLRSTLHPNLKLKVQAAVGINASGPEVLISAIKEAFTGDGYTQLEKLKNDIKALQLKNFPGEDIHALNEVIKDKMERLDAADMVKVGDNLLLEIVGIYEQSTAEHFRLWAVNKYADVQKFVKQCRYSDPTTLLGIPDPITYATLVADSNAKYLELKGDDRYPPALTSHPKTELDPVAMIAEITKRATQSVLAKVGSSTGGANDKARANNSHTGQTKPNNGGSTDEAKSNDAKGDGKAKFTKLPKNFPQGKKEWVTHLPNGWDPATKVFQLGGKDYKWCTDCKRWCFHRAGEGHAKWAAKRSSGTANTGSPAKTTPPATTKATVTLAEVVDSDSDDDNGWSPYNPYRI